MITVIRGIGGIPLKAFSHHDPISSAGGHSFTQEPPHDCNCIFSSDRGRSSVQHDCGEFQLYKSPWLDFLNLLDVSIQVVTVTTCILTLTSHRKLMIERGHIPNWFPRLLAFAP